MADLLIPVFEEGSATLYRNQRLESLYHDLLVELGDSGILLVPNKANDQTVTFTTRQKHSDGIEAVFTWDSAPSLTYEGITHQWLFDGLDAEADTPDAAYWSTAGAISMGGIYKFNVAVSNILLSKWDETSAGDAQDREWKMFTDSNGDFGWQAYDESNNASIGRKIDTAVVTGVQTHLGASFTGGTDAANIILYKEGVAADDADIVDDAGFADMVDGATVVAMGYEEDASGAKANFMDGVMGITYVSLSVLTPEQFKTIDRLLKAAVGKI